MRKPRVVSLPVLNEAHEVMRREKTHNPIMSAFLDEFARPFAAQHGRRYVVTSWALVMKTYKRYMAIEPDPDVRREVNARFLRSDETFVIERDYALNLLLIDSRFRQLHTIARETLDDRRARARRAERQAEIERSEAEERARWHAERSVIPFPRTGTND